MPRIPGCCGCSAASELWARRGAPAGAARRAIATPPRRCAASPRAIPRSTDRAATSSTSRRASTPAARNASRRRRWPREADDLLALTAYVAYQSRGMPMAVHDRRARARVVRARAGAVLHERHGQMNLACAQCHDENWGKRLLAENDQPGPRHRVPRVPARMAEPGIAAAAHPRVLFRDSCRDAAPGAPELTDLELYLAWRAQGLPLEAPGVRR